MTFPQPFADYEILDRLGSGAMGTVFKARHKRLNRMVALKVLRPSLARNERYVERLRREARIVAALNHPNIVAGYDLGSEGGYHYFVMEYVEGQSLRQILAEWGMFPPERVLDIALQITAALDHAYRRGVIHRDIKPGNILLDAQQTVKLTDMGLAKGPTDLTITRHGATVGTPQYISPEQAADPQSADVRSDLYSLGATLFHMATGSPPFTGDTMAQILGKVMHERAPSAKELNPEVGDGLDLVIRKLLAKDPTLRYQTPAELLEDLRRVQREEAPRVDRRALETESPVRRGRGRWLWPAGVVAAAAIVVVSLSPLLSSGDRDRPPVSADTTIWTSRLARASGVADRLAVLRQAMANDVDPTTIRALRAQIDPELHAAIDTFARNWSLGARRDDAEKWFADVGHWRQPERFFEEELPAAFEQQVGVPPSELPAELRSDWQQRLAELRSHSEQWRKARDDALLLRFEDWLNEQVAAAWRAQLENRDFVAAADAVRSRIDDFFRKPGMPDRAQLPDGLQARMAAMEHDAVQQAMAVIDAEEKQAADDLEGYVERSLSDLREKREVERLRASRLIALLGRLREELAAYPPSASFHGAHDPWRRVQSQLALLQGELDGDLLLEEAADVDRAVERAYATMLKLGDADLAALWLSLDSLRLPESCAIRDRHRQLLSAAAGVADLVLRAALADGTQRSLRLRRAGPGGGAPVETVLTRDGDGWRLSLAGESEPLPLTEIYFRDLLEAAGGLPSDASAEQRAGAALWLYVTGDEADAAQMLDERWQAFFAHHVSDAVDRVRQTREDLDLPTLDRLAQLRRAWAAQPRDADALRQALAAMATGAGADHTEQPLLREVRTWLDAFDARQHRQQQVAAAAPPGSEVTVDAQDRVTIDWRPAGGDLPLDWEAASVGVRFLGEDVPLAEARNASALGFASPVADAHDVELELTMQFPPVGGKHLLYLIEAHGAVVALGILRDGSVIAAVESTSSLDKPASLRVALERALAQQPPADGPRVVPGAKHVIGVQVVMGEMRANVRVSLDGAPLARRQVARPSRTPMRVRLLPLQPVQLDALALRAIE